MPPTILHARTHSFTQTYQFVPDRYSTYCGLPDGQTPTCYCKDGFQNLHTNNRNVSICSRIPTATTVTSTTTTANTPLQLQIAYRNAMTVTCGRNYSAVEGSQNIVGARGGDTSFKLYVSRTADQPVTLTTCNPNTNFSTMITVYSQLLDAASNTYRFAQIASNNIMYPYVATTCLLGLFL